MCCYTRGKGLKTRESGKIEKVSIYRTSNFRRIIHGWFAGASFLREEWILKGDSLGSDLSVGSYTVGQFSEGQCYTGRQFVWGHFTGGNFPVSNYIGANHSGGNLMGAVLLAPTNLA